MGGLVSGVTDAVGDVVGGVGDIAGGLVKTAAPYAGLIGAASGVPGGALIGSMLGGALGGAGNTQQSQQAYGNMLQGLLGTSASVQQNKVSQAAAEAAQRQALAGGQTAANMAAFKPVGTTTRFGASNFQFDPTTGQLTSAGYTPSALAQGYQNQLAGMTSQGLMQGQQQQNLASQYLASQQGQPVSALGQQYMASQMGQPLTQAGLQDLRSNVGQPLTTLGQQYMGESPEAIRQRYVEQQTALLAPQQEQQLAGIRNNLFQTGRQGLATGATSAGGLAATNPEMAAYYNSLANQQRQITAGADQAAQQQAQFGAGLYGTGTGLTQQARQQAASQFATGQGLTQAGQVAGAGLYGTGLGLTQQGQQFGQSLGASAFSPFTAGFGAQGAVEQAAQQPLTLSTDLAKLQAASGAQQGQLYNTGAQTAARMGLLPEMQTSNTATFLSGLSSPTSGLSNAFGGLFGGLGGGSIGSVLPNIGSWYDSSAQDF
jgi:hypothetical protein